MNILDGNSLSNLIKQDLYKRVAHLRKSGITPTLAIIYVGNDPRSLSYIKQKMKVARHLGIIVGLHRFLKRIKPTTIKTFIQRLNKNGDVDGIIIQLPLPTDLPSEQLINIIDPAKDVDGLTDTNQRLLGTGNPPVVPATPSGIIALLNHYRIPIKNARITIIGRGRLVGRPLAAMLKKLGAQVSVGHSQTRNLTAITRKADVIVSASGVGGLITADMIKSESVLIDAGIAKVNNRLLGDITGEAKEKARLATPTIGGVGPMTVICLLANVVGAAEIRLGRLAKNYNQGHRG